MTWYILSKDFIFFVLILPNIKYLCLMALNICAYGYAISVWIWNFRKKKNSLLFLRIINIFSKITKQLWQLLLWKSQLWLCFEAGTCSLAKEESVCSNSCENLSLFGLWNTMACTCLVASSQSLAAQMSKESVLSQPVPWPHGRLTWVGPIPWDNWICWIPATSLKLMFLIILFGCYTAKM